MSKYTIENSEGVHIDNQLSVSDSLEFTNNDLEGIIDMVGGAGVIVIDSSISVPFSFAIQDELMNNFLSINGTNGNILVYNLLEYNSDPTLLTDWGDLSVANKAYVDSLVGGSDTFSEILSNSNTSGGTDLIMSSGDKVIFNNSGFTSSISEPLLSSNITLTLPTNSGTFALVSDIQANNELSEILANGNTTGGNDIQLDSDGGFSSGDKLYFEFNNGNIIGANPIITQELLKVFNLQPGSEITAGGIEHLLEVIGQDNPSLQGMMRFRALS